MVNLKIQAEHNYQTTYLMKGHLSLMAFHVIGQRSHRGCS